MPLAVAHYGQASVAIERVDGRRRLVYRAIPSADGRVLRVRVPFFRAIGDQVALGLDGRDHLTAVVTGRRGLFFTRVNGRVKLKKVPGTGRGDSAPSLFRGRFAFADLGSVRAGRLRYPDRRLLWSPDPLDNYVPSQTAIGAGGAVAFVVVADGAEQALFDAKVVRRDGTEQDVWPRDVHSGQLRLRTTRNGRRLSVRGDKTLRYRLPNATRIR